VFSKASLTRANAHRGLPDRMERQYSTVLTGLQIFRYDLAAMLDRRLIANILDALYTDVMEAKARLESAQNQRSQIPHQRARKALELAVEKYMDFAMDGNVPEDVEMRVRGASSGN
jgi:hypothetical protein